MQLSVEYHNEINNSLYENFIIFPLQMRHKIFPLAKTFVGAFKLVLTSPSLARPVVLGKYPIFISKIAKSVVTRGEATLQAQTHVTRRDK